VCEPSFLNPSEKYFELARLAPALPTAPARQNRIWRHKKIANASIDFVARSVPEYTILATAQPRGSSIAGFRPLIKGKKMY
jgi:hypothetical protein